MIEIEFIGTGGQGSVVASKLLADAAVKAGYNSQSFASYGSQRRGGEVESYVRLDKEKILLHSKVYQPDFLILMDESFTRIPRETGLEKGTKILVNTSSPESESLSQEGYDVVTIDANRIANEKGLTLPSGLPVINTIILGAITGLLPSVEIDHLVEALRDGKIPAVEKNIEAAREAYQKINKSPEVLDKEKSEITESRLAVTEMLPQFLDRMSPCDASCPAGEEVERTAYFIQYGHFEDALESIMAENPFPGICGRVCFHPCEANCNRVQFDEGIATNALERAAFDYADASLVRKPEKRPATGKKVAIIGSGPAGMTCANYLALLGHSVTVFEAQPVAGGVPRFGIPEYHLPREIVDREIAQVTGLGVDIKLNTRIGKDIDFNKITGEYDACFIAVGAHRSVKLGTAGEDNKSVFSGIDFLRRVGLGEKVNIGTGVVVIGGGNVAMDVARTALRSGAKEVTAVCLESREEMPAYSWETAEAEAEGVNIKNSWGPEKIVSNGEKISAIEFKKCLSVFDNQGKFNPSYATGNTFIMDCDTVITAVGETLELPFPDGTVNMSGAVIEIDELGRTSLPTVYAGGDSVNLSRSVVEAIASGKRAALGIDLFLTGGDEKAVETFEKGTSGAVSMGRYLAGDYTRDSNSVVSYEDLNVVHFTGEPRLAPSELPVKTRIQNFTETNLGLTREDAIAEAERCFHCGHCVLCEICYISCPDTAILLDSDNLIFKLDEEVCKSCGICIYECPRHAISWKGVAQ